MITEDAALDMILEEGRECRKIVTEATFSTCPPEIRRVYLFLVNSSIANLKRKQNGMAFLSGGGIGAGIMAGLEVYGRFKGWW